MFSSRGMVLVTSAVLLAATGGLTACSSAGSSGGSGSSTPVEQSVSPAITLVDVQTAQGLIDQGAPVLDVRTPAEFAAGHLAGAVNVDMEAADFATAVTALDPSKAWVVYCRTGRRSALATGQMEQLGFTQMYDMSGGITAWQAAGLPVTTS